MKKLSLIALVLLVSAMGANAQEVNTKTRHKADENVPIAVLAAIEANHPGLTFQQQLMEPAPAPRKERKSGRLKRSGQPLLLSCIRSFQAEKITKKGSCTIRMVFWSIQKKGSEIQPCHWLFVNILAGNIMAG